MHDFIQYIFSLFRQGMFLVVPAVGICIAIFIVLFLMYRKKGRTFPLKKSLIILLLVGWAVLTVFVTLLRGETGFRSWNFHLFMAWREAWNQFTLQVWLNILLNIALFVPLGILLPLLAKKFQRFIPMLVAGFGTSFCIELSQLILQKGIFDVDDLFTNTLGAMLGWGITMAVLAVVVREDAWKKKFIQALIIPIAFSVAMATIFISYDRKSYGNLPDAATVAADLKEVQWTVDFPLTNTQQKAWVYEAGRMDREASDAFAENFMSRAKVTLPDRYYYDDLIIYANHSTGEFLHVNLKDGTWEYKKGSGREFTYDTPPAQITAKELSQYLSEWNITIPENATFSIEPSGLEGKYDASFLAVVDLEQGQNFYGTITCTFREENGKTVLTNIQNNMVLLNPCKEETIISLEEAVQLLYDGKSFEGIALEFSEIKSVEIVSYSLDWMVDTKGFYQPVYCFVLVVPEGETVMDYVPALE